MKKGLCLWLVFCIAVLCFSGCGEKGAEGINENRYSLDNFTTLLTAGEYAKAAAMYQNTAVGNIQRETEIQNALTDFAASVVKAYLEDRQDYEAANIDLGTVRRVVEQTGLELSALTDSEKQLEEAKASKIAYDSGCELMTAQDYAGAIGQFQKVVQGDSHYASAQEQIQTATNSCKSAALTKAEAYVAKQDYDNALQTIEQALDILPDDSDLKIKQATYSQSYVTAVIAQADKALVNPGKDYEKAINLLKPAMQKYPDNANLKKKYDYYMGFEPVSLFDLEPYMEDGTIHSGEHLSDTRGKTYENGWYTLGSYLSCGGEMVYDVQKWDLLTGIVSVYEGSESQKESGSLKIYGDNKLLYEKTITRSSTSENFSLNITGITNLKIKMDTASWYGADVLLADVTLQKTVK